MRYFAGTSSIRLVFLGSKAVGKSSLICRIILDSFNEECNSTTGIYKKEIEFESAPLDLEIIDTSGPDVDTIMKNECIRSGDGFFLVFDITNKNSYRDIVKIKHSLKEIRTDCEFALLVLGNKVDLEDERQVLTSDVDEVVEKWGCHYLETSAKSGKCVNEALMLIAMELKKINKISRRRKIDTDKQPCCFIV